MTLQGIDYFNHRYFLYNRRLLSIVGLWPYQESSQRLRYAYSISMVVLAGIIEQIYAFILLDFKPEQIISLLQTFLPTFCFACCYCNLLFNLSKVKKIYDRMKCDWDELANEKELIVMIKYAKQTRLWTLSISYVCYLYAIFLILPSIIRIFLYIIGTINHTELVLPVRMEYFLQDKSRYFSMLSLQFAIISTVSTLGVANYSMLVSFLQHARALFSITILKVNYPFKKHSYRSCTARFFTSSEKEREWMISVIRCYNESIKFVSRVLKRKFINLIKSVFGKVYLMETSMASFFIIIDFLYIFQLFASTKSISETLKDCVYIGATLLVIYVYCYLGQKLIDHNSAVFITCCQVPFYMLSLKIQKVLLLLIIKTMRPCNFSVTRMIVTSHELFANLIQTSCSYALVFYNVF